MDIRMEGNMVYVRWERQKRAKKHVFANNVQALDFVKWVSNLALSNITDEHLAMCRAEKVSEVA